MTQAVAEIPRTPWGAPDLNGVWKFSIATPLERPEEYVEQTHFSEAEAAVFLAGADDRLDDLASFLDGGEEKYVGLELWMSTDLPLTNDRRTSLIYEPGNGKIPALTEAAKARQEAQPQPTGGSRGSPQSFQCRPEVGSLSKL